jgi:4-carboxymuconolactone decarboxylase
MNITELKKTDPEFADIFDFFANNEVINEDGMQLDNQTRYMSIIASLLGCQALDAFNQIIEEAMLNDVLSAVEVKEIVYQGVDYLGMGKVYPFIIATNEVMEKLDIPLPLESQSTTTQDIRLEKGIQAQVDIFGEGMQEFWKGGHINRWLAANCFGDYYTRKGLELKQREMITFCFLAAQGGCETQLFSHVMGNLNLGNDKVFLIRIVSQCLPYIGYPRSLNALSCINKATEQADA